MIENQDEKVQDHINDLIEEAASESESMAGGSFVQTEAQTVQAVGRVLRVVLAVMFGLFLALLCVPAGVIVGVFLSLMLSPIIFSAMGPTHVGLEGMLLP